MSQKEIIAAVGAGRMGRGMAVAFAYSGHKVRLIDAKARDADGFDALKTSAESDLRAVLSMMADFGLLTRSEVDTVTRRIEIFACDRIAEALAGIPVIFEGVPETLNAKEETFGLISQHAPPDAIIASTTSTILSNHLQGFVSNPERFLNAHWLNPAYLAPLVELSPGDATASDTTAQLKSLLERIGKVPVVCTASPGYIVPRIQALAMNEAARLVEEGVASPEDIDKATKYGFGFRFAVLGLLEFIDWGGGDILYYASRYMANATGEDRFQAPQIVQQNMAEGRNGLRDGEGFMQYDGMDIPAYRKERIGAFAAMLRHLDKMPVKG
ncbi:MAG: 3-hydroxybutyryl-CoA dehydrogenase [Rhodobacteraceae bacterium]|nr:3-hydroxybutyryl-CoA dehydrogenase [Paracoccaceae bacterium]